jgi:hypothetical protein
MTGPEGRRLRIALAVTLVATGLRVAWALAVPTIPVGDFAMYRESANYLVEWGHLDSGFIYMPGVVLLLAVVQVAGGEIVAAKLMGALFGGLATAAIYYLTARLIDEPRMGDVERRAGWSGNAPAALTASVLYALWPAGLTLASVIGTDVPTAALLALALALLHGWGPRRPLLAAIAFGAAMGLAAYLRAVALPLTALSAGYWWSRRAGARAIVLRTALAVGVTLAVLSPWAVRNVRAGGGLSFADSHGGITALMGNYPNTEGTYSRSLGAMFKDLTGRTFLTQPHHETDRVAYAMAKRWMAFDPAWTAGMVALRLERLFAPERGLLYWSIFRPGVLPRGPADWFGQHRAGITALVDDFYVFFVLCLAAGFGFAVAERRVGLAVPVACAAMLAVTYALFVAEPRYRLTTEILLFPVAGFGLARLGAIAMALLRRTAPVAKVVREARAGLLLTAAVVVGVIVSSVLVVTGGQALRDHHRWAATVWHVNGQPQPAFWRRASAGPSPVRGLADGVTLVLPAGRSEVDAEIVRPDGGGPGPNVELQTTLTWQGGADTGARLELAGVEALAPATAARGVLPSPADHLRVRLTAGPHQEPISVPIRAVTLTTRRQ